MIMKKENKMQKSEQMTRQQTLDLEIHTIERFNEIWFCHFAGPVHVKTGDEYYGSFPIGLTKHLKLIGFIQYPLVHLCSGMSRLGDIRVDINPNTNANKVMDARHTDIPNNYASCVLIDPYYSEADFARMKQGYVSPYEFLKEATRITKPNGYVGLLHTKQCASKYGLKMIGWACVYIGPDKLLRTFTVYRKLPS